MTDFNECVKYAELAEHPHSGIQLAKATTLIKEYEQLCNAERQLYQSKERMNWYKDGDASTSLFHRNIKQHQARNRITQIQNETGVLIEDYNGIKKIVVDFYQKLFTAPNKVNTGFDIVQMVKKSITMEEVDMLSRPINAEEIEEAMLNMKLGKAPGPEAFTTEFYKDAWPIVKQSVIEVVQTFATSYITMFFNSTTIALIPKQTAYVPGKNIADGILLMQELVCGYHRKEGKAMCTLKIDIRKAYDIVD
ncbi:hypothetical protein LIER_34941 [Lithospermum erythrorhizon]|uniref:Reverse transcriptase domain-containing protein n=1 Tax=Lithospermum erythrorhizon TaxID=34254 RepID=A0AAV3NI78_LITER